MLRRKYFFMNLNIQFKNLQGTGEMIDYIDRRLSFAFAKTRDKIEYINIILSDINGQRNGIDKQCRVKVKVRGIKAVVITEQKEVLQRAIDGCLSRASQSIDRKLKRRHLLAKKATSANPTYTELLQAN